MKHKKNKQLENIIDGASYKRVMKQQNRLT